MKFLKISLAVVISMVFSLSVLAHDPKGESFKLSGVLVHLYLDFELVQNL